MEQRESLQTIIDIISSSGAGEGIATINTTTRKGSGTSAGRYIIYSYQETHVVLHANAYGDISMSEWSKLESLLDSAVMGIDYNIIPTENKIVITHNHINN